MNDSFCAISSGHLAPVRHTSAMLTIVCPGMPAMLTGKEQTKGGSRSPDARCAIHG